MRPQNQPKENDQEENKSTDFKQRMTVQETNRINKLIQRRYNKQYESLRLSKSSVRDWVFILQQKQQTNLRTLRMDRCNIDVNNIHTLGLLLSPTPVNKIYESLKQLNLSQNRIGSRGAKILAKIKFKRIQSILLDQCEIQDVGLIHLTKSVWPSLKILHLRCNNIKITGLSSIAMYGNWKLSCFFVIEHQKPFIQLIALNQSMPLKRGFPFFSGSAHYGIIRTIRDMVKNKYPRWYQQ